MSLNIMKSHKLKKMGTFAGAQATEVHGSQQSMSKVSKVSINLGSSLGKELNGSSLMNDSKSS